MIRRLPQIVIALLLIFLSVVCYFYMQPPLAIKQLTVEPGVPVKVGIEQGRAKQRILVYLPFKITVSNNRLRTLRMEGIRAKPFDKEVYWDGEDLIFDRKGNTVPDPRQGIKYSDELLHDKKYGAYIKWNYFMENQRWRPFVAKDIYFYYPVGINSTPLSAEPSGEVRSALLIDFRENQTKFLHTKSSYDIEQQVNIDSLYETVAGEKVMFTFQKKGWTKLGGHRLVYELNTGRQKVTNDYKALMKLKSREAIYEYLEKDPFKEYD